MSLRRKSSKKPKNNSKNETAPYRNCEVAFRRLKDEFGAHHVRVRGHEKVTGT